MIKRLFRKNKFSEAKIETTTTKIEPTEPQNDEDFIARFDEFVGVKFYSHNGLSGSSHRRELVVSEHPELKDQILSFAQRYPIINLLQGDRNNDGFDLDHWELTFLFDDSRFNRRICGYGVTESTKPYLNEMIFFIPEVLSKEEILRRRMEEEMMLMAFSRLDDKKSE